MRTKALAVLLGGFLGCGCLVQVDETGDPEEAFRRAREEAVSLQGTPGPAHEAKVLVYDLKSKELVRVSVPLWLAHKIARENHGDEGMGIHGKVDFAELEKAGRGASVEINDESGERVLVWLH